MIWLFPAAAIGLIAIAAPIVVHVLVRQRATRVPFPTLRFIQPHRLASVRRRALEDAALLTLRAAILAGAVAAVAGPFLITAARLRAWNARIVRADASGADPRQALIRAVAWLERQPPGRREIVVQDALPLGSLTDADIAAVPRHIGLRFQRSTALPASRVLRAQSVVDSGRTIDRELTLDGDRTSVRDLASSTSASSALEIVSPPDQEAAAATLRNAIAQRRQPAPSPNHRARVVFGATSAPATAVTVAWMADAAARISREVDPGHAATLQFGADGDRLVVSTSTSAADREAADVAQAVARSLAPPPEQTTGEILPIPDAQLRAWTRDAGPAVPPTPETLGQDDRRWLWAVVLLLIGVETWLRRERNDSAAARDVSRAA